MVSINQLARPNNNTDMGRLYQATSYRPWVNGEREKKRGPGEGELLAAGLRCGESPVTTASSAYIAYKWDPRRELLGPWMGGGEEERGGGELKV